MKTDLWALAIVSLSVFFCPARGNAQDVLGGLPSLPSGFSEVPSTATPVSSPSRPGDQSFDASFGLSILSDSNVRQGNDRGGFPVESDLIISPTLSLNYLRTRSLWQLGGRAQVTRQLFQKSSDFNATNYSLGMFGGYQSTKLVTSFTSDLSSISGVNRLSGVFIEQFSYATGALARYHLSGKTSFLASWNQQNTESQSAGFGDISSTTLGASALWRATPLISLGPGLRYGIRSGDNRTGDFTVVGPTLRLDYDLASRVKLRSSLGYDFSESPATDDRTLVNWSLALDYSPSDLWGLGVTMVRDTQATFITGGGFDQTSSYGLTYRRKVRKAQVAFNLSYQVRDPQDSLRAVNGIRDSNFLSYGASLALPVFGDKANLSTNLTWREQTSQDDNFSWEGLQLGANLRWNF